jgi:trimethylamine--corrinoid protein Co-methyltransferase
MLATQVGSNLIHDLGYMEMGMTASLELIVLANEMIDSFQRYFRPLQIDIDTLALDLIDRIGPAGNFLSEDHTVDHIKDLWMPNLIDRTDFNTWQANGSLPLEKKLNERVIWILENHTPEPLKAGVLEAINGVIERAERKYRK